ncbi:CD300a molecule [Rhinolophus ferrumequinum]|uniref:CD300a molecule n=1 Tax=Rhinolophus ferrumequinum TaxID=59479 RepID=A0A7J7TBV3_RHIFE|nr:CD300a molecule [Rhinolophus ferrumequinum]
MMTQQDRARWLPSALALLLLWVPARENLEPLQDPGQAAQQTEPCYADLELLPWPVLEEPVKPRPMEVEYSTVGPCKDNLHYSSVVFNHQSQDSKDKAPSRKPLLEETEYRVIRA